MEIIVRPLRKEGWDEFGSVPVQIYMDREGKRMPLNYSYYQPRRDINDGWLTTVRRHTEEGGVELEEVLSSMAGASGNFGLIFESEILNLTYQIRVEVPLGEKITSPKRDMVVKLMKAEGTGLESYASSALRNLELFEIEGKSQTIYKFLKSRPELVYSS